MTLLSLTYLPKSSQDIIGQDDNIAKIKHFITHYTTIKKKALFIYGPLGTGKTSTIHAIARELKYDLLELNSSDARNKDAMASFLSSSLGQQSLFMLPKIILIDEVDNFSGRKDRGGLALLAKSLQKSSFPVIVTANDPFESKFNALRKISLMLEFQKVPHTTIFAHLHSICQKEEIESEEKALKSIARQCDGDVRAALIDLTTLAASGAVTYDSLKNLTDRKRTDTIFHALNIIFKASTSDIAKTAFQTTDIKPDDVLLWLDENIPHEYKTASALAKSYEMLSRADIFKRRIMRRQHWRYLVYVFDLLSVGVSMSKDAKNPKFIDYKRSSRLLKMWMAKNKLAKRKEIAAKLAEKTHVSSRVAFMHIPFLQHIFKGGEQSHIIRDLELSPEEVAWLKR
jgi:replication factor C large subunit